jgi:O-antigen/teichoic acid export membrane protein
VDAMVKGMGQQTASVRYNILTNMLDVILLYILLPKYGMIGYFFSFLVTHILNFGLSLRRLLKTTREQIPFHVPLLTIAAGLFSIWAANSVPTPALQTAAFSLLLLCSLFLLGIIQKEDIFWINGLMRKK